MLDRCCFACDGDICRLLSEKILLDSLDVTDCFRNLWSTCLWCYLRVWLLYLWGTVLFWRIRMFIKDLFHKRDSSSGVFSVPNLCWCDSLLVLPALHQNRGYWHVFRTSCKDGNTFSNNSDIEINWSCFYYTLCENLPEYWFIRCYKIVKLTTCSF